MNIVTRKHLARRTFLRGLGAGIALPWLDAMCPAFAATTAAPLRIAFVYVPNGIVMDRWTPAASGHAFEFTRILKPLEPLREKIAVLSGLDHRNAKPLGDGPGDHARAGACFLTGVHPRKTAGKDLQVGISADQIVAAKMEGVTRFPSLELGTEDNRTTGACDSGYSCAYTNSISWRAPASPMPPETNPRLVFERLFGSEDGTLDPGARARRMSYRKSILDMAQDDTRRIAATLGAGDKRKLDEYLFAVREIERRIEAAESDPRRAEPSMPTPAGVPFYFSEHLRLMYALQAAAFQGDLTRVSTFVTGREGSTRTYPEIDVPDQHHPITHHRGDPALIEKVTKVNEFHTRQLASFLQKLDGMREGDGTLLDRTMIVYGSAIADGNVHSHENLPVLLAGGGAADIKPGTHIRYPRGTPMTNLYLTLLDRMGVNAESIGDSTGELNHLTDI